MKVGARWDMWRDEGRGEIHPGEKIWDVNQPMDLYRSRQHKKMAGLLKGKKGGRSN